MKKNYFYIANYIFNFIFGIFCIVSLQIIFQRFDFLLFFIEVIIFFGSFISIGNGVYFTDDYIVAIINFKKYKKKISEIRGINKIKGYSKKIEILFEMDEQEGIENQISFIIQYYFQKKKLNRFLYKIHDINNIYYFIDKKKVSWDLLLKKL